MAHSNMKLCTCRLVFSEKLNLCMCFFYKDICTVLLILLWGGGEAGTRTLVHNKDKFLTLTYSTCTWAMVGWITSPFFSFYFLKASVLCTCISM